MRGMRRDNIEKCRIMRRNQTDAEMKLWSVLRNRQLSGVKFRRQFPVGKYILDFYAPEYNLAIEADGGQHYHQTGKMNDEVRSKELKAHGIQVLRFSNRDILNNIGGVCEMICEAVTGRRMPPHLSPLPEGERR